MNEVYETRRWNGEIVDSFQADSEEAAIGLAIRSAAHRGELVKLISVTGEWERTVLPDGHVSKFHDTFYDPKIHD